MGMETIAYLTGIPQLIIAKIYLLKGSKLDK